MTAKGRAKKIAQIPEGYKKIAMLFREPNEFGELERRLNNREGKVIPDHVLSRMRDNFDEPTLAEGFDEIVENIPEFSGKST